MPGWRIAFRGRKQAARLRSVLAAAGCVLLIALPALARGGEVSFRRDVMAVLSKAGCNQGTCHGNRAGKGGFKLSLRGQDPDLDHAAITAGLAGRRVNRVDPEESLLILKPTAQVPHQGGMRFEIGSLEHQIISGWIAAGARRDPPDLPHLERLEVAPREAYLVEPQDRVRIRVQAVFSDGSRRDVTRLAVYEPVDLLAAVDAGGLVRRAGFGETTILVRYLQIQEPVRIAFIPERPEFIWKDPPVNNYIDELVFARLRALRLLPSDLSSDTAFLRRAYLDLLGAPPTAGEAREFAADHSPGKRARLIDRLLERPEFADFWALKWSDLLRNEEKVLDRKGVQNFHHWIRSAIAAGMPLDRFVHDLVAARGSTYANPPANFYRANRDPTARAEAAAQLFLGVRLQCARCHDHPFERWTQDDYYGWTALFARVRYKVLENRRRDKNDGHEFIGEQIVWIDREGEVADPRTGAPAPPRFLGAAAEAPGRTPGSGPETERDRLEALSEWIASPASPLFARAQANRIWFNLMGVGIVEPVDDMRSTNPPSNSPLLDALADDFARGGFDLRRLIRTIMNSRVYQLSSMPNDTNRDDERNFSRAIIRRLAAEQLLDSQSQALAAPARFNGYPPGLRAAQLPGVMAVRDRDQPPSPGDQFLRVFGKPPRLLTCECERSGDSNLGQAFQLINGPAINEQLTRPGNRLAQLLGSGRSIPAIVEELYWAALSRAPSPMEAKAAAEHLEGAPERREALEDIAWSLLNSKEFLLRY